MQEFNFNPAKTCCFTGHREIPTNLYIQAKEETTQKVETLINNGYCDFICGGARGYDTLAGAVVLILQRKYPHIKLHLFLPYNHGPRGETDTERRLYEMVAERATTINYINENYHRFCMRERNEAMVNASSYCIAFCTRITGGSAGTIKYALKRKKYVHILPVCNMGILDFSQNDYRKSPL